MFAFALALLIWCQVSILGQENGVRFSHPETSLPVTSGLVTGVPVVPTSPSDSNGMEGLDGAFSRTAAAFRGGNRGNRRTCIKFLTLVFRTADGSCNSQDNRGQSLQPLTRLLPPAYDDGVEAPRNASVLNSDLPLPGPRLVSRVIHPDLRNTSKLTIYVMQWGQFIDHEMVSTPLPVEDTRGVVECCGPNGGPPLGNESSECFPVIFQSGDPDFRGTCMSLVRSMPINGDDGNILLPRENMNVITSFIDGSTVYGSTAERLEELRDPNKRYLLRTTEDDFPPDSGINGCVKRDNNDICFLAGDDRVNEHPGLVLLHTVFLRYHNVLARSLRYHNLYASDEFVFQQARAIVGAVIQKILYEDWLPLFLGPKIRWKFNLNLEKVTEHDPTQDPRIFTSFATAAFRFGHSLIPRSLPLTPNRRPLLRELFFKPFEARENLDTLADGFAQAADLEDRSQPLDRHMVEEVTGHLFENEEGERQGFDLAALNIQRGRDHGLPSYNTFRENLGLGRVTSFEDPALGDAGSLLQQVYADVDDIDLFSGGLVEPGFNGGLAGETFSNMMAIQFQRLKFGDRFFFTNKRRPFGFRKYQIKLIRKISLAHLLCLTTKLSKIQPDVFTIPQKRKNRQQSCRVLIKKHPSMFYFIRYPF